MMGFIASIVEAYGELRVNKGRVLLALIGVSFSVFAMTTVLGAGGMLSSALQQSLEQSMGRATVLTVQSMGDPASGSSGGDPATAAARRDRVVQQAFDRYGITQRSRSSQVTLRLQTRQGVRQVETNAVDPAYGNMYRKRVKQGRWLGPNDADRLAPALVVDQKLYDQLGRPTLGSQIVTAYGSGTASVGMVVIGVLPPAEEFGPPSSAFIHAGALKAVPGASEGVMMSSYLAWVPPEQAGTVEGQLRSALGDTPEGTFDVMQMSGSLEDIGFQQVQWALLGVSVVILILGVLGLVNISLVTVRYRMREIGIRRSYGATGLRIFVGVLMESVVATVVAGIVGVTAAVALMRAPFVQNFFRDQGLVDLPPFPVSAVLAGLAAATVVGALAGIIPALIATRVKVIDAIRA